MPLIENIFRADQNLQTVIHKMNDIAIHIVIINLPIALILTTAFILPDYIMLWITGNDNAVYTPLAVFFIFLFAFILTLSGTWLVFLILSVLGLFEIIHFSYMAYFGGVIDANIIMQIFSEYEDILKASFGLYQYLVFAPLIIIIPYSLAWFVFRKFDAKRITVPFIWIVLAVLFCIVPGKIIAAGNAVKYYPQDVFPSVANSYLTFSTLAFNHIPKTLFNWNIGKNSGNYLPVSVFVNNDVPEKITIVVIMNESLTSDRMSVFGFNRDTTPQLYRLAQDSNFVYKQGISSGIGTRSTFYPFWNGIRDPRDEKEYMAQTTNLFKLAKQNKFTTTFISMQGNNLLRGTGTGFIDNLVTEEMIIKQYDAYHDEALLKLAKDIQLDNRNFIVLHLRSVHSPYEENYQKHRDIAIFPTENLDYANYMRNSYDNAIRYSDMINTNIIDLFKSKTSNPLYIFITSDHGQMMGENNKKQFGHAILVPEVAHVPIMLYEQNGEPSVLEDFRELNNPTHYELTRIISRVMGFEINDPNAKDGVFYINGLGYYGQNGYIKVIKNNRLQNNVEFKIVKN